MELVMVSPKDAVVRDFISKSAGDKRQNLDYFGQSSGRDFGPEGFLVWIHNRTLGAHFHDVDQFQILLGRQGSLFQRTAVPEVMVHYADAYSTYGPLIGAAEPLRFFTLRADPTEFIGYMPADRDKLQHKGRRQRHFTVGSDGANRKDEEVLIGDEGDGLYASIIHAHPGTPVRIGATSGSRGAFVYIARGSVNWDGKTFGPESLGWLPPDSDAVELECVEEGQVVVMRFPGHATNPRFAA